MPQAITLYGTETCRFTNRARGQLDSLGLAYDFIDLEQDRSEDARLRQGSGGRRQTPTVEIDYDGKKRRLVQPNDWQLETELIQAGLLKERAQRPGSRTVIRGPRAIIDDRR